MYIKINPTLHSSSHFFFFTFDISKHTARFHHNHNSIITVPKHTIPNHNHSHISFEIQHKINIITRTKKLSLKQPVFSQPCLIVILLRHPQYTLLYSFYKFYSFFCVLCFCKSNSSPFLSFIHRVKTRNASFVYMSVEREEKKTDEYSLMRNMYILYKGNNREEVVRCIIIKLSNLYDFLNLTDYFFYIRVKFFYHNSSKHPIIIPYTMGLWYVSVLLLMQCYFCIQLMCFHFEVDFSSFCSSSWSFVDFCFWYLG